MKRLTMFALISVFCGILSIQSAFAGPFGIDMGMSLDEVKRVCKTSPKHIQDNVYEIKPPKTNDLFETYVVRIDPDYGVYWMKAMGKDIYTNDYGDRLISTFNLLVESIRKTYGEESYKVDSLKEGSIWGDPQYFMYALQRGDRALYAMWSKEFDLMKELLSDPICLEYIYSGEEIDIEDLDNTALQSLVLNKVEEYKKLPKDIARIGVFTKALSSSSGYVSLEYSFSNEAEVQAKADSVF